MFLSVSSYAHVRLARFLSFTSRKACLGYKVCQFTLTGCMLRRPTPVSPQMQCTSCSETATVMMWGMKPTACTVVRNTQVSHPYKHPTPPPYPPPAPLPAFPLCGLRDSTTFSPTGVRIAGGQDGPSGTHQQRKEIQGV